MTQLLDDLVAAIQARDYFQTIGKRADHAIALTAQGNNREKLPAAYVIPPDDAPEDNRLVNATSQKVTLTIDIVIGVSNLTDPTDTGKDAVDAVERAKWEVRQALHGKTFGAADPYLETVFPLRYAGGYKLGYDTSQFWYVAQYAMDTYYRKT